MHHHNCRYNEVLSYNYGNPGFSMTTGHFTAVVWRSSTLLGCTVKVCDSIQNLNWDNGGTLVICRYAPAGNVQGQYAENVLPPAVSAPAPATIPGGWMLRSPSCLGSVDARFRLCVQVSKKCCTYCFDLERGCNGLGRGCAGVGKGLAALVLEGAVLCYVL
jgi:hypothetical protein